jgi:hypothetical protein
MPLARKIVLTLPIAVALVWGCAKENPASTEDASNPPARPKGSKILLAAEPPGAQDVLEIRRQAKNGNDVVLIGRVGGSKNPFSDGRSEFTLVDLSLKPCNDSDCSTPWDYCRADPRELAQGTATVRFVDANGNVLQKDPRAYWGIKALRVIVVRGRVKLNEQGNLVILAKDMFLKS